MLDSRVTIINGSTLGNLGLAVVGVLSGTMHGLFVRSFSGSFGLHLVNAR